MATFPLAHRNARDNARNAKLLARLEREAGGEEQEAKFASQHTAADERSLRGIPAVGRGCASVMPGTDPLRALLAKEQGRRQ